MIQSRSLKIKVWDNIMVKISNIVANYNISIRYASAVKLDGNNEEKIWKELCDSVDNESFDSLSEQEQKEIITRLHIQNSFATMSLRETKNESAILLLNASRARTTATIMTLTQ
jgi:uncharacterized protein with ACT and thioredoxin-like domain